MFTCMCVCKCLCVFVYVGVWVYVCPWVYLRVYRYGRGCVRVCLCVCIFSLLCVMTHMAIYFQYTCIYISKLHTTHALLINFRQQSHGSINFFFSER